MVNLQTLEGTVMGSKVKQYMTVNNYFGQYIRQLRIEKGWTQLQLAKICDVTETTIGHIEQGRRPNITVMTLNKLDKAFRQKGNLIRMYLSGLN